MNPKKPFSPRNRQLNSLFRKIFQDFLFFSQNTISNSLQTISTALAPSADVLLLEFTCLSNKNNLLQQFETFLTKYQTTLTDFCRVFEEDVNKIGNNKEIGHNSSTVASSTEIFSSKNFPTTPIELQGQIAETADKLEKYLEKQDKFQKRIEILSKKPYSTIKIDALLQIQIDLRLIFAVTQANNFLIIDSTKFIKKMEILLAQIFNQYINNYSIEIKSGLLKIDESLINFSQILQNPGKFQEEKDMILLEKLKFHMKDDRFQLSHLSERFLLLSKITQALEKVTSDRNDTTIVNQLEVNKNSLVKFTENFSKLNRKIEIAKTLLDRTEKRLLGLDSIENDQNLQSRLENFPNLRSASFSRLRSYRNEKLIASKSLQAFIERYLHEASVTLGNVGENTDPDQKVSILNYHNNLVQLNVKISEIISHVEVMSNKMIREIEHLKLTGEPDANLEEFLESANHPSNLKIEGFHSIASFFTAGQGFLDQFKLSLEKDGAEVKIRKFPSVSEGKKSGTLQTIFIPFLQATVPFEQFITVLENNLYDHPIFTWLYNEIIDIIKNIDALSELAKIQHKLVFDDFKDLLIELNLYNNEKAVYKFRVERLVCNLKPESKVAIHQLISKGRSSSISGQREKFIREQVLDIRLAIGDFVHWDEVFVTNEDGTRVNQRRDVNTNIKFISNLQKIIDLLKKSLIMLGPNELHKDEETKKIHKNTKDRYDWLRIYQKFQTHILFLASRNFTLTSPQILSSINSVLFNLSEKSATLKDLSANAHFSLFLTNKNLKMIETQAEKEVRKIILKYPVFEYNFNDGMVNSLEDKCKIFTKSYIYNDFIRKFLDLFEISGLRFVKNVEDQMFLSKYQVQFHGKDVGNDLGISPFYPGDLPATQNLLQIIQKNFYKSNNSSDFLSKFKNNLLKQVSSRDLSIKSIKSALSKLNISKFPDGKESLSSLESQLKLNEKSADYKALSTLKIPYSLKEKIAAKNKFIVHIPKILPTMHLRKLFWQMAKKPIIWLTKDKNSERVPIDPEILCAILKEGYWVICDEFQPEINFFNFDKEKSEISRSNERSRSHSRVKFRKEIKDDSTVSQNGLEILSDWPMSIHKDSKIFILDKNPSQSQNNTEPLKIETNQGLLKSHFKFQEIKLLFSYAYERKLLNLDEIGLLIDDLNFKLVSNLHQLPEDLQYQTNLEEIDRFFSKCDFLIESDVENSNSNSDNRNQSDLDGVSDSFNQVRRKLFPAAFMPIFNFFEDILHQRTDEEKSNRIIVINNRKINLSVEFIDRANLLIG